MLCLYCLTFFVFVFLFSLSFSVLPNHFLLTHIYKSFSQKFIVFYKLSLCWFFMLAKFEPRFIFVHLDFQLFWNHLTQRLLFVHATILASLLRINCTCMFGSLSGLFMLFPWSIPLSLIQYHSVLITILVLLENLKSDHLEHPTFFFFSKLFWLFLVIYKFPEQKILLGFWLIVLFYKSIGGKLL